MLQEAQNLTKDPLMHEDHDRIQTTLYDLIEAVNEIVKPNDNRLVTAVVMDMLNSGHANFQTTYH